MERIVPDRVVVMWDGFNAGKLRYDIYKPYKENRKKDWEKTERAVITDGIGVTPEEKEKLEILKQKMQVRNLLDELFIRQAEIDFIEADDLIAHYVLKSENDDEQIFIYSRDRDYLQLISDKVFVISPDNALILGKKEYEEKYGNIIENELMFKCFEGDNSDCIKGIKGITRKTLLKYFPAIAKEQYTYSRLVEECYEAKKKKKLKTYDIIINAQQDLYRNAKLMNLKKPFINDEGKKAVDIVKHGMLGDDRDIAAGVSLLIEYGIMSFIGEQFIDVFLSPFYAIMLKEKEFTNNMKI